MYTNERGKTDIKAVDQSFHPAIKEQMRRVVTPEQTMNEAGLKTLVEEIEYCDVMLAMPDQIAPPPMNIRR